MVTDLSLQKNKKGLGVTVSRMRIMSNASSKET